jgi:hypothetical protein
LYELDEVVAALMWCVVSGRIMEAAFWCQELLETDAAAAARNALFMAWVWHFAPRAMGIGHQILTTQDRILELAVTMARSAYKWRDGSVFALIVNGYTVKSEFDRVAEWGPETHGRTPQQRTFHQALKQRKALLAWSVARTHWPTAWDWLDAPDWLQDAESRSPWPIRAVAVAAAAMTEKERAESNETTWRLPPAEIEDALLEWEALSGRRARRRYAIPVDALFWLTARGNLSYKESTAPALQDDLNTALAASDFWQTFMPADFDAKEESYEEFYDTWFPDDIPDEWSCADREKSHGGGVLQPTETPRFEKYARRWWARCDSSVMWDGVQAAIRECPQIDIARGWDTLYSEKMDEWVEQEKTWSFIPAAKRLIVSSSS